MALLPYKHTNCQHTNCHMAVNTDTEIIAPVIYIHMHTHTHTHNLLQGMVPSLSQWSRLLSQKIYHHGRHWATFRASHVLGHVCVYIYIQCAFIHICRYIHQILCLVNWSMYPCIYTYIYACIYTHMHTTRTSTCICVCLSAMILSKDKICLILTAIPMIFEGLFQAFQQSFSSKLVLNTVQSCFVAPNYYENGSSVS